MIPIVILAVLLAGERAFQATTLAAQSPDELVQALGQFPAGIPGMAPANGVLPATERHRREIYDRLWSLGSIALPAVCRGLSDSDVQVRRNAALFLGAAGGGWYDRERAPLEVQGCVPALLRVLADPDGRVRELAAQAVGATGAAGAAAVPGLIALLGSSSEGDRNSACVGLAGIGVAARDALPALEKVLSDPSAHVRGFAKRAIERIDR